MKHYFQIFTLLLLLANQNSAWTATTAAVKVYLASEKTHYNSTVSSVDTQSLVKKYQFTSESAHCFVSFRDNMYSHHVDYALKSEKAFEANVRSCLKTYEFLSTYRLAENQAEIVSVFHDLLKRRYALLNYVLPLATGSVEKRSDLSVYFPDARSVRETFIQSLINLVDDGLTTKMSQDMKAQFSTLQAWTAILEAFSAPKDALNPFAQNSFNFDIREPCCVVM